MKITGYAKSETEDDSFVELSEIAIATPPETLRAIAAFLLEAADEMDELGNEYDHVHLMDRWDNWKEGCPDIQILSKKYI